MLTDKTKNKITLRIKMFQIKPFIEIKYKG